jgi:hypothetical protein
MSGAELEDAPTDWRPGPRPEWVRALHTVADPAWIRLEPDELLAEASARAGGLTDFGDADFEEPYRIFVRALDAEAQLHAVGRLIARSDVVNWLENRLGLASFRKRRPEIAREPVAAPLFITGLPRTGTSILHELLAQDPAHRVPLHWEVRHPCPPPGAADEEARVARAEQQVQLWNHVVPEYRVMHELGAKLPVECIQLTAHSFRSEELMGRHQVPSYAAWYAGCDLAPAYRFHRALLQHLQSGGRRGERWVLKAPSHLPALPTLFSVYADARVVVTHRDPLKILPSVASILYSTAYVRSDAVDPQAMLGWFTGETCRGLLDGMTAFRASGAVDPRRFHDLRYADLVAKPLDTIGALYDAFGLRLSAAAEARMRAYLDAKPKGKHGAHRYDFAATGLSRDAERERFRSYQERYGVPSEV